MTGRVDAAGSRPRDQIRADRSLICAKGKTRTLKFVARSYDAARERIFFFLFFSQKHCIGLNWSRYICDNTVVAVSC